MADKKRNIKNQDSQLFKSLTRLFSGPLVNFRQQAQLRFRRRDLNKFDFKSASGKQFQKTSYNPFDAIQANIMANQSRAERYSDFDQMEYSAEIASTMDIYADEMTTHSSITKMLNIRSSNQEIKGILESLYYDVLNVEFNLFGWCRTMCKFGDMFLYLDIDPDLGVKNVIGLPTPEIERLEGQDKTNPNYVQYQWNSGGLTFENWQIAHFRILGQDKYAPYGTSVLEPARRIWRQLNLLEDAMMAYRIVRAPDRRVFYIDVGNIASEDVEQFMLKIQNQMKRNMIVDPTTGRVDLRYNPMCLTLNTKIPLLDGRTLSLEEIIKERESGKIDQWVYSIQENTKKLVPGKVVWSGITRKNASLVRVHLDDGATFDVTPDHKFMLRNGEFKEAKDLISGEALMPLYRKYSTKEDRIKREGYEMVYDPSIEEYVLTHKMVADDILVEQKKVLQENLKDNNKFLVIHHKDIRKQNNNPENLVYMGNSDHFKYHQDHCEKTLHRPEVREIVVQKLIEYNKSDEKRAKTAQQNKEFGKALKMGQIYNSSELHKEHNAIRKATQLESWSKNREQRSSAMRWNIPDECIEIAKEIYANNPKANRDQFIDLFKKDERISQLITIANSGKARKIEKLSRIPVEQKLKSLGYAGLEDFKKQSISCKEYKNHKVCKIEMLSYTQDTGCITVEGVNGEHDRHNFAIETTLQNGLNSAVFVRNSIDEDYFIPTRGQSGTRIDTLAGGNFVGDIDDVKYLRDKLFSALKIPQSYLARDENASEDKTTLAQKDIRFARTIQRLQNFVVSELEKIGIIHLFTLGYRNEDLLNFSLSLNNPSKISELQELEHWKTKFDVAAQATEGFFSKRWVAEKIFNLSEQDFKRIQREMFYDKQFEKMLEGVAAGAEAGGDAGLGGAPGGDLGGGLGGEETPEAPTGGTEAEAAPEEPQVLSVDQLAAKRRDNGYKHVAVDRRESGGRLRHMKSDAIPEAGLGATNRTMFQGYDNLTALSKLSEGVERDDDNEARLHEVNSDIKNLLGSLENMDAKIRKT